MLRSGFLELRLQVDAVLSENFTTLVSVRQIQDLKELLDAFMPYPTLRQYSHSHRAKCQ